VAMACEGGSAAACHEMGDLSYETRQYDVASAWCFVFFFFFLNAAACHEMGDFSYETRQYDVASAWCFFGYR